MNRIISHTGHFSHRRHYTATTQSDHMGMS